MSITIYEGSILDVKADAIVNPANSFLRHGGGLARIIANAAKDYGKITPVTQPHGLHTGREQEIIDAAGRAWQAEQDAHPLIPTGGAALTSAGHLPYKGVIHAVGPVWGGGDYEEDILLELAHISVLELCYAERFESVVLPAISCGIFGYPPELAARIALQTAAGASDYGVSNVTFAIVDPVVLGCFRDAKGELR